MGLLIAVENSNMQTKQAYTTAQKLSVTETELCGEAWARGGCAQRTGRAAVYLGLEASGAGTWGYRQGHSCSQGGERDCHRPGKC